MNDGLVFDNKKMLDKIRINSNYGTTAANTLSRVFYKGELISKDERDLRIVEDALNDLEL